MKKFIGFLVVILIIIVVIVLLNSGSPEGIEESTISDADVTEESDEVTDSSNKSALLTESSKLTASIDSFTFTGYGPGRQHTGTFESFSVEDVVIDDGEAVAGKIIFEAGTVSTDAGEKLNKHLCNEDFFECDKYPDVVFSLVEVEDGVDENHFVVTGNLDFHGATKQITFTITKEEDSYSADFTLDTTPFNFKYVGVDKDVRIQFTGTLKTEE